MLEIYIAIGILIFINISLFVMLIIFMNKYQESQTNNHRRFLVMDTHHRSEKRYLTLLLLEAKGINTGVKATAELYKKFIQENKDLEEVEKFAKEEVEKSKLGKTRIIK